MKTLLQKTVFIAFLMIIGLCINQTASAATYYSKATGNANVLGNWGIVLDGTGTAPTNFTTSGDIFILRSASTMSLSAAWTIPVGVTLQMDGVLNVTSNNDDIAVNGTIIFSGTSVNQITLTGGGNGNNFTLGTTATLKTLNANGVRGTNCSLPTTSTGTITLPATANYEFNGAVQSTLGLPTPVNNLTMSGGTKTLSAATTVSGNFSIATGASVNLGGFTNTASTLTLGGLGTINGTWGSTTSAATNKNTTYFAGTAGTLGVTTDTRTTPTVTPIVGTYTYNGSAQGPTTATNTGTSTSYTYSYVGVSGTTYTTSATPPTNAGSYTVTVTVAASTDGFYKPASSIATSFTIGKATPTLSVTNSLVIYTGAGQSAAVSGSVAGTVSSILTGGNATQTNAATYAVSANFVPTDATNYNSLTAASAGIFVINKATPTLSLTNTPQNYTGSSIAATVSGTGGGVVSNIKYSGSSSAPTNAGTYAVTAEIAASANYTAATTASAGNFVISPIALAITADNTSKCFGNTPVLGTTAFTSLGLVSPQTIGSVTLSSAGAASDAGVNSYSIVPSAATGGTFLASNYAITYTNGVLTVNPTNTVGAASSAPTVCINTALSTITHTTTGATGIGTATGLPAGVTAVFASDMITISGTPTASGTFNYTIPLTGGCGSLNATGTITVGDPASLTITSTTPATICQPGMVTLAASASAGTSNWYDASTAGNLVGTGTSFTTPFISTTTTYYVEATNNSCVSASRTAVIATVNNNNTWTGTTSTAWTTASNWTCGAVPVASTIVVIAASANQPIIASNASISALTINTGAMLTVTSGNNLTVSNSVLNSGTMTLENNANLLQAATTTTNSNTGNIIVKRNSSSLLRLDHTLWSSPVANQNLYGFSPATLTNRFYTYNTLSNGYVATGLDATTAFKAGKGYAVRAPNNQSSVSPTIWEGTFTGIPNNGTVPFTLDNGGSGFNLVGNPYPSPISATAFLAENAGKISGTLYFYAHSLTMNADGIFPSGTNYATWNSIAAVAATAAASGDLHPTPVASNGIIQVGQGFFVKAIGSRDINFTNAMRVGNNANQFMRTTEIEKHRLWLNLATENGTDINQIVVAYVAGATQGIDGNFDAVPFGNNGSSLSSKINGADYVIQGRSLPFDSNDAVPLGFTAATTGNYKIILTAKDGLFAGNQDVFVRDNIMGIDHNIKLSPYTFTSTAGKFDARFQLVYKQALGIPSTNFTPNSVLVFKNSEGFHVTTNGTMMKDILVFDISGRLVFKQAGINAESAVLKGLSQTRQVLLLKISSLENETVTVKTMN